MPEPDILVRICDTKRVWIAESERNRPLAVIDADARAAPPPRGFAEAVRSALDTGYALIAEIKKASPSKGLIRADFDPPSLARAYARGGATCLSVLTDEPYFQGHDSNLNAARDAVGLPVLRKDFMLEPYQIAESRALGADCILLIIAALDDSAAAELEDMAFGYAMDVLIEVHDEAELERAMRLRSPLIGVNNRNLKTMVTDLAVGERVIALIPDDRIAIAESGLNTPTDLARMARCGARTFLIGESLMRQFDVEAATRTLLAHSPAAGQSVTEVTA